MMYLFGFQKVAVALSDLYFLSGNPAAVDEGAERGVRLEVRFLVEGDIEGSAVASHPIVIDRPIWRADLLERAVGVPGSFDRTHHHSAIRGWEPGKRFYDEALSANPIDWVGSALGDLDELLAQSEFSADDVGPDDARLLRDAVPEIKATLTRLLGRVHAGELAAIPAGDPVPVRLGWL